MEDQHPRDHRAQQRLLGRQGPGRPGRLQGRARGGRPDDRAADRRRRHGAVPVAGPAPGPAQGPEVHRARDDRASASSSPASTPACRRWTTCVCGRRCSTPSIARPSWTTSWRARPAPPSVCWRPACSATRTCSSTSSIRSTVRRPRRCWPRPAGRRARTASWPKGGQRLSLSWLAARGRYPKDGEITEAIQAMFKEVGVEAKVQVLEWAAVFQQVRGNPLNHHMFTLGWVTSNADADYSLYPLFHSKQAPPTGWNTSRYANARVDTLVEQARRSLNQTEREKLYGEVQDILAKEMVWIPVYTTKEIIATRAGVKGFPIHPVEYNLALWKTWVDDRSGGPRDGPRHPPAFTPLMLTFVVRRLLLAVPGPARRGVRRHAHRRSAAGRRRHPDARRARHQGGGGQAARPPRPRQAVRRPLPRLRRPRGARATSGARSSRTARWWPSWPTPGRPRCSSRWPRCSSPPWPASQPGWPRPCGPTRSSTRWPGSARCSASRCRSSGPAWC